MNARPNRRPRLRPLALALALFAAAALPLGAAAQSAPGDWKWTLTPYAWATDVGVDVELGDRTLVDEEIPVAELLEDVETIVQLRIEAQKGRHGLFLDLFDVNLADEAQTVALPRGAGSAEITPAMGMTIAEVGGLYDPRGDGDGLQLLYGARLIDQRAELEARFAPAGGAEVERRIDGRDTFVDALVGLRWLRPLGGRWGFQLQADLSAGGTELTWSVEPALSFALGESRRSAAIVGYRRMDVDFEDAGRDAALDARMSLSGPYFAVRFGF